MNHRETVRPGTTALATAVFAGIGVGGWCGASAMNAPVLERNVSGILDNSFLVEEAYNQGDGEVQHIFTMFASRDQRSGRDEKRYDLTFVQEWPLAGMTHQIGFTLPYSFVESGGVSDNGLGDLQVDYRYQVYYQEETLTGFAPRFSLILPTGNADRGFGEDTAGGQVNLPFSTALNDEWFLHLNAGTTFFPDAASANDHCLWHFNLGASAIYAPRRDLHFLLEWVGDWTEERSAGGNRRHEFSALLSPGVRKAFNFANGSQLVVGAAVPIGLTGSAPDYGAFFYLSFEHLFRHASK